MTLRTKLPILACAAILAVSCTNGTGGNGEESSRLPVNLKMNVAEIYLTAEKDQLFMTKMADAAFEASGQPDEHFPTIMVDPDHQFQTIEGIGGALTDASAETLYKLPQEQQNKILTAYFDPDDGIGYSLVRTNINSCDFSSDSYAYTETEGDVSLDDFTIEHDLKFKIPLIKEAFKYTNGDLKLFASPWSPPAWMKTNNNMLQGGQLKPEYASAWADYFVRFVQEYENAGIPVWGLTVQNEPMAVQTWESCIYSAEEERDFVKEHLGPALWNNGMEDLKLMIWDHNRGLMVQRAATVYDDEEASQYVWGMGFHWYTGDHFENVKLVSEAYPDKHTLFTEGCVYPFNYDSLHVWHYGETYGLSIINDLNNGASGWTDWNILLDEQGGPNHVGNFCLAPVVAHTVTGEVTFMSSFYYLGHFSKFIRPGARRVTCSSNNDDLLTTAFLNTDGTLAVVVMNPTGSDMEYKLWSDYKAIITQAPAHSISTTLIR
ncbi:MAG: glycoside hydrolase family 30 protein [Bacteroidota bacterium]